MEKREFEQGKGVMRKMAAKKNRAPKNMMQIIYPNINSNSYFHNLNRYLYATQR